MTMELNFNGKTLIMGILNITPDSFYDGGRFIDRDRAIERAFQMEREGADILDIGGESTRPGSNPVSLQEEIDRVCPIIEELSDKIGIPLSIDTYKSAVAEEALKAGASIVNDISAMAFDEKMADIVSRYQAYIVLMHIMGTPKNMQINPRYDKLLEEIFDYLQKATVIALNRGIQREKIIVDPGIGFGKTVEDNYLLISNLAYFKKIGFPVLIGISNKSLIGKLYEEDYSRLPATIALNSISVINGADIIRVHEIEPHRLALKAVEMLKRN